MARLGLSEILENTSKQPTEQQGEYLRVNYNPTLGQLIRYAYDASFEWDLPEGTPPYKPNEHLDQESNLYAETRRLYVFMKGSGDHVPAKRKEMLFVQLLESLSKEDAKLLCLIKDRQLPYGITSDFIVAELPNLITSPIAQDEVQHTNDTFQLADTSGDVDTGTQSGEEVIAPPAPARKPAAKKAAPTKRKPVAKKTVARKAKVADK